MLVLSTLLAAGLCWAVYEAARNQNNGLADALVVLGPMLVGGLAALTKRLAPVMVMTALALFGSIYANTRGRHDFDTSMYGIISNRVDSEHRYRMGRLREEQKSRDSQIQNATRGTEFNARDAERALRAMERK